MTTESTTPPGWEERLAAAWATADTCDDFDAARAGEFRAVVDALAAELPAGHPVAAFERGGAFDSTGCPDRAVPLYQEALRLGLSGVRARRAKVQLASSLRNLGRPEEGVALLEPELSAPSDAFDDAIRACLALCLSDVGRDREGLGLVLGALAPHLPRYRRSMARYAEELTAPGQEPTPTAK